METKHTPGKWEICATSETQIHIASTEKNARTEQGKGSYICQIKQERQHYGINEQDKANARLIAAAPDLLKALKTIQSNLDVLKGLTANNAEAHNLITLCNQLAVETLYKQNKF